MGKRKSSLRRCSSNAKRIKLNRETESDNDRRMRLKIMKNNAIRLRQNESIQNRCLRLESMKNHAKFVRLNENESVRDIRISSVRNRADARRQFSDLKLAAFQYDCEIEYK